MAERAYFLKIILLIVTWFINEAKNNEAKNMPFEAAIWFGIENGVTFGMTQDLWYGTC